MNATLRFEVSGGIACLYTDAFDLRQLGRLRIVRATEIRFNHDTQRWVVYHANTGEPLHSDPSRDACAAWEREHLGPAGKSTNHP